ncbi:response regulator [Ottowia thiooxydans]|uniref:response regulator n=1 Tax=Ottowia thiooxydans TaxID=219182 RepID=UPI00041ED9A4|nr:response regulator [Ottowia thiooxydans]
MKPATILVVEDETDMAVIILDYLRHAGYEAEHIRDGRAALERILQAPPSLTLLDIMLPGMDGLDVLREARRHTACPVILLTARVEEMDRLLGLELGADDYICKPFAPREVVARVKAVLRRSQVPEREKSLVLLAEQGRAMLHGQALPLTNRELCILQVLMKQPGRVFSRSQLLDLACGDTLDVNDRAIDSHIKHLRKKIKAAGGGDHEWIRSVYGLGFAFEPG